MTRRSVQSRLCLVTSLKALDVMGRKHAIYLLLVNNLVLADSFTCEIRSLYVGSKTKFNTIYYNNNLAVCHSNHDFVSSEHIF